jgi:hypothetical protein
MDGHRQIRILATKLRLPAALLAALLVAFALWSCNPDGLPNLSGTYMADDGGIYYVQQSGKTLWWAGMSLDRELPPDLQWHRGLSFTNVFSGTIGRRNIVTGGWSDVPRGTILSHGQLKLQVTASGAGIEFVKVAATGGFGGSKWHRIAALDDTSFNGSGMDIIARFDAVKKNDGNAIHDNNLKPYRDQTVVYGRLTTDHLEYTGDNGPESEIPHVNFGPEFSPPIPGFRNFGKRGREFDDFACFFKDDGDADFDMRLKVNLDKLEPDFYTTGWGDRDQGPQVFSLKLNDGNTRGKLKLAANEGYMGLESIMYGRPGTCDDNEVSPVNGGLSMLPGWADLFSNSVLVNGQPMNGLFNGPNPAPNCDFVQPCPFVSGVDATNYLVVPAGIQVGDLLLSANGDGHIIPKGDIVGCLTGTYLRVTGTLVLDCGHADFLDHPCYDDDPDGDPGDISGHSNQEIHPIYSIDIINYPYRPEDIQVLGPRNLTGSYGGSDGSTYYVRQIGNTIWWLSQMRDRQPMQRGTHSPIIGSNQLKPAFAANDPPCSSNQCWAFATVFKGTITESPIQSVIEGDWAGVPQSTSAGSSGGHMKFFVFNRKIIIPGSASIFPVTIEKMYDPPGALAARE